MTTDRHKQHLAARVSHSDCCECRADTERRFVDTSVWKYAHVREYLQYTTSRLQAIKAGNTTVDARIWYQKFMLALQRRISLKVPADSRRGRKYCDSYLERLGQFPRGTNSGYLQRFAQRGASCLDY